MSQFGLQNPSIHYSQHLDDLRRACQWFGVSNGRSLKYAKLIKEFFGKSERSREHILVYNESFEITELYKLWKPYVAGFARLKEKIRRCLEKGPLLREDERPNRSTNKWRNHLFEYLLAGKLINGSVPVVAVDGMVAEGENYDGDSDVSFRWGKKIYDIQCKRPQNQNRLVDRIKEGRDQIKKYGRQGPSGFVAVDCSLFITNLGYELKANSEDALRQQLFQILEKEIKPVVVKYITHKSVN